MKRFVAAFAALALASCVSADVEPASQRGSTYKVYFLGGQSNMEGFGYVSQLPEAYRGEQAAVPIFHGRTVEDGKEGGGIGAWMPLRPGHGTGFTADETANVYSDRFGPELAFAESMREGGEKIAIIKFARGGTGLVHGVSGYGSWDPDYSEGNGLNQYDFALRSIRDALAKGDIDGDGLVDTLIPSGIVWMQGEADAYDNFPASSEYARNLARLMGLLRAALGDGDLPVVVGRIKDSGDTPETRVMKYSPLVQEQQAEFVAGDSCANLVDATKSFGFLPDGWHYRSEDYLVLGKAFAEAMADLEARC